MPDEEGVETPVVETDDDAGLGDEQPVVDETDDSTLQDSTATYTLSDGTEVPLDELEKGYLRQSDYTKKTQSLAQQRAEMEQALRVVQALEEDPQGTLEVLTRHLLGDAADNEAEDLDPLEAQLRQHEQRFQELDDQAAERQINSMLDNLAVQYPDLDREATLDWAVQNEIPNLEAAWLHYQAHQAAEAQRSQRNADALARKRQAPPIGGRGPAAGSQAVQYREVKTLKDAFANAQAELAGSEFS